MNFMNCNVKNNIETKTIITQNDNKFILYSGVVDGRNTQYLTSNEEWNFSLRVFVVNGEMKYIDDENNEIIVSEEDDETWINH